MTEEELTEYLCSGDNNMPIIAYVPNNTCRIIFNVMIMDDDGEMHEASSIMNLKEVMDARVAGEEWEFNNVKYRLSEKTQREIEEKGINQVANEILEEIKKGEKR